MFNLKSLLWHIKFLMNVLHVEHALTNVRWMQFPRVISIKLMQTFAPTVAHVLKFARLSVFR